MFNSDRFICALFDDDAPFLYSFRHLLVRYFGFLQWRQKRCHRNPDINKTKYKRRSFRLINHFRTSNWGVDFALHCLRFVLFAIIIIVIIITIIIIITYLHHCVDIGLRRDPGGRRRHYSTDRHEVGALASIT